MAKSNRTKLRQCERHKVASCLSHSGPRLLALALCRWRMEIRAGASYSSMELHVSVSVSLKSLFVVVSNPIPRQPAGQYETLRTINFECSTLSTPFRNYDSDPLHGTIELRGSALTHPRRGQACTQGNLEPSRTGNYY